MVTELATARSAVDCDQVTPFYQPKIDLQSGCVVGFEALLRWHDHNHRVQPPATIAAAFDDAELAILLDQRMFERVAIDIAAWEESGLPFGRVAINVSAAQFWQEDFASDLLQRIECSGISAAHLELEVTETVFLGRASQHTLQTFERLRAAGMTIALDDFGTGYASLIHLKQFPVDALKIDCSFIQTLADPANLSIARAIVNLGKNLGIMTVAEGIETQAQAYLLSQSGCDLGQGFLFSPAVAAEHVPKLLADREDRVWRRSERRRQAHCTMSTSGT